MDIFKANSNRSQKQGFIPARPSAWFISAAQQLIRIQLTLKDRLQLHEKDVEILSRLPTGSGVILASNHADETDTRVCLELSRRSRRSFITMCNREAFDEMRGLAGWALQRLGYFSVERGARDLQAKSYAIEVVRGGKHVLVVFPEGEIFYQNEQLQHFHSGAIDIGFQAIAENRKESPSWTAFVVPMVIKYHYSRSIEGELDQRISRMEGDLSIPKSTDSLQERLLAIATKLIQRKQAAHQLITADGVDQNLTQEITLAKNAIFTEVELRHKQMPVSEHLPLIDRVWQLAAELRQKAKDPADQTTRNALQKDLDALQEVGHLASWSPRYLRGASSYDRLAESVIKLERELYRVKRPRPIAGRDILVTLSEPIDMARYVSDYEQDARTACRQVTQQLQEQIQELLNKLAEASHIGPLPK